VLGSFVDTSVGFRIAVSGEITTIDFREANRLVSAKQDG
jgi:hypothetical protein